MTVNNSQSATFVIINSAAAGCSSYPPLLRMITECTCICEIVSEILISGLFIIKSARLRSYFTKGKFHSVTVPVKLLNLAAKHEPNYILQMTITFLICCHRAHACKHDNSARNKGLN